MGNQKDLEFIERVIAIRRTLFSEDFETAKSRVVEAIDLMSDYGGVLVESAEGDAILPESLLPHDKETIKDALRMHLLAGPDKSLSELIRVQYQNLAFFVADDEYERIKLEAEDIYERTSLKLADLEDLDVEVFTDKEKVEAVRQLLKQMEKVVEGREILEAELTRWLEDTQRKLDKAGQESPSTAPGGCMVILTVVGLAAVAGGLLAVSWFVA